MWLSLQPERLHDFVTLVSWCRVWLDGHDVYATVPSVDYPPWAIVVFSAIAAVPAPVAAPVWVALNVAMLLLAAWRWSADRAPAERWLVWCLLVAAGAGRTLNQFSLFAFAAATASAGGSWVRTGLWLGLSLVKPQIGGVFVLLAALDGQWRRLAVAGVVPVALLGLYSLHAHATPWAVASEYVGTWQDAYAMVGTGRTEVTPWLPWRQSALGVAMGLLAVGVVALSPLVVRRGTGERRLLAGLASLLSVRHLSYDLVLLLPGIALMEGAWLWGATLFCVANPSAILG